LLAIRYAKNPRSLTKSIAERSDRGKPAPTVL